MPVEKDEKKDFVIKDRRIFSEKEPEKQEQSESHSAEEPLDEGKDAPEEKPPEDVDTEQPQLPEINFQTFIFSLNASALVQLGVMEDPATGKKHKTLPLAKQTIDMLSMLQEKTEGNLTTEEAELMKHILYDLRMRFVKEKG
jgi:hypothetical protein